MISTIGFIHSIESNYLVTCVRENLPIFHPFRRLLDIFTYRTININCGVKLSLLEKGMLIHRSGGFDIKGLKTAFRDIVIKIRLYLYMFIIIFSCCTISCR